eukprot:GHVN01074060.1.p1 GENE.GHVN01074060.1~~GHVN01074060.1.p1  ORF type:complete len:536 (+),score=89.10 GHVN01074060.1:4361-5968(+)
MCKTSISLVFLTYLTLLNHIKQADADAFGAPDTLLDHIKRDNPYSSVDTQPSSSTQFTHHFTSAHLDERSAPVHRRLPPMGWNSWNKFGCDESKLNQRTMMDIADAMVNNGFLQVGYRYLNIDDCWSTGPGKRGGGESLVADPKRFPFGMKSLADFIHKRGLKFGIYADAGTNTCQGYPGSLGHEEEDAKLFESWGVDFVKLDGCNPQSMEGLEAGYEKWGDALRSVGRDMVFSCSWPAYQIANGDPSNFPWQKMHAMGCDMWRLYGDISNDFSSVLNIVNYMAKYQDTLHEVQSSNGGFNDPDMLEIGNSKLSFDESKSQMTIWAIWSAPLIMGHDLRIDDPTLTGILTHPEVIAINQDPILQWGLLTHTICPPSPSFNLDLQHFLHERTERGESVTPPSTPLTCVSVWKKKLVNGFAIAMLNPTNEPYSAVPIDLHTLRITSLNDPQLINPRRLRVRDVWARQDLSTSPDTPTSPHSLDVTETTASLRVALNAHGAALFRLSEVPNESTWRGDLGRLGQEISDRFEEVSEYGE